MASPEGRALLLKLAQEDGGPGSIERAYATVAAFEARARASELARVREIIMRDGTAKTPWELVQAIEAPDV